MLHKLQHIALCGVDQTHYLHSRKSFDCACGTRLEFMLPLHNSRMREESAVHYEPDWINIVTSTIFEISLRCAGTLAITPRPRGGDWLEVDVAALSAGGVNILVSLLESDEAAELGLTEEFACCAAHGIEFLSLPLPDLAAPSDSATFVTAATHLAQLLRQGKHIAVHCRQSVGRSGLLAVSVAVASGHELGEAVETVSKARGVQVPETPIQLTCLRRYEGHLSGNTG
jgi:protein-tyrosine phosphatase